MPTAVNKLQSPGGKLAFAGPLDITRAPRSGSLYVADFGKQSLFGEDSSMVWLRPADRKSSIGGAKKRKRIETDLL